MNILLLWNDASAHRNIKYSVEYLIEGDVLHVFDVCPVEVALLDHKWGTVVTQMKIRSAKAYEMLRNRFLDSDQLNSLVERIAAHHSLSLVTYPR